MSAVVGIERTKNDLGTPPWFLPFVRRVGPIVLDPCSNPWSLVRARVELSAHRGEDGLATDWSEILRAHGGAGLAYSNPPYGVGHLPKWAAKFSLEAERDAEIVGLVPCSPDTAWWETMLDACDARCDVHRRIGFEGGEHGSGQVRSEVFYFGPNPYLFGHSFDELGEVHVYRRRRRTARGRR